MQIFNKAKNLLLLCLIVTLFACAKKISDPLDIQTGLTFSDFNKGIVKDFKKNKKDKEAELVIEAPIPNASRLVVVAPPPSTVTSKTISFSVTDRVPLKDVLIELGRISKIDLDLDPAISGGVIINARNRPLGEVIDRIAVLGKLRYSYENGILHFERDTPYTHNYSVDYLSDGSNLWGDVQANITAILSNSANNKTSENASISQNSADGANNSSSSMAQSIITINKTAGILSIFATKKEHDEIVKYLAKVEKNSSAQVLIEAKVVEVKLKDIYKTGINWGFSDSNVRGTNSASVNGGYASASPLDVSIGVLVGKSLNASVSALETFGATRTLSSPRVHAINNQKATLNFTDKLVYFKIENNQNTTTTTAAAAVNTQTLTSTKQEENVGVELSITPSINLKTNEVTLKIKPKITVSNSTVTDPASPKDPDTGKITFENKVPVIQTREIDTIAKVQSGNVIVIGGLMQESSDNTDTGIPFLQRIPILGYLFKSTSKDSTITETVIFIKATIVNSGTQADKVDREMQEKFDTNRRKFF